MDSEALMLAIAGIVVGAVYLMRRRSRLNNQG
jgi:hypothetical protein